MVVTEGFTAQLPPHLCLGVLLICYVPVIEATTGTSPTHFVTCGAALAFAGSLLFLFLKQCQCNAQHFLLHRTVWATSHASFQLVFCATPLWLFFYLAGGALFYDLCTWHKGSSSVCGGFGRWEYFCLLWASQYLFAFLSCHRSAVCGLPLGLL